MWFENLDKISIKLRFENLLLIWLHCAAILSALAVTVFCLSSNFSIEHYMCYIPRFRAIICINLVIFFMPPKNAEWIINNAVTHVCIVLAVVCWVHWVVIFIIFAINPWVFLLADLTQHRTWLEIFIFIALAFFLRNYKQKLRARKNALVFTTQDEKNAAEMRDDWSCNIHRYINRFIIVVIALSCMTFIAWVGCFYRLIFLEGLELPSLFTVIDYLFVTLPWLVDCLLEWPEAWLKENDAIIGVGCWFIITYAIVWRCFLSSRISIARIVVIFTLIAIAPPLGLVSQWSLNWILQLIGLLVTFSYVVFELNNFIVFFFSLLVLFCRCIVHAIPKYFEWFIDYLLSRTGGLADGFAPDDKASLYRFAFKVLFVVIAFTVTEYPFMHLFFFLGCKGFTCFLVFEVVAALLGILYIFAKLNGFKYLAVLQLILISILIIGGVMNFIILLI